ncbi:hypothetical protein [Amycolatopsis sp. 195334CR]|uniref:hypothetical protein n=1 Tax=Amycolatopsis sp. 195334CR TaxID=2814588 RepID=UPI001A8D6B70|nr:hypothetical protein [Amycolatopsis sp. 195334CR]MBN6035984.1 hypothetical protein [Amycolatopsis sp. 195334CR]
MTRRFDPDQIAELAKKVGALQDRFTTAGTDLGDGDPGGAYGSLKNAANAGQATKGFYSGVNSEFTAAAGLVEAASQALSIAAERMRNDEDAVIHTLGSGREQA